MFQSLNSAITYKVLGFIKIPGNSYHYLISISLCDYGKIEIHDWAYMCVCVWEGIVSFPLFVLCWGWNQLFCVFKCLFGSFVYLFCCLATTKNSCVLNFVEVSQLFRKWTRTERRKKTKVKKKRRKQSVYLWVCVYECVGKTKESKSHSGEGGGGVSATATSWIRRTSSPTKGTQVDRYSMKFAQKKNRETKQWQYTYIRTEKMQRI